VQNLKIAHFEESYGNIKNMPFNFFIGEFISDSMILGRIDRLYDLIVLCLHMTVLTITLYRYTLADDGK
jgi:hypothetical protein